MLPRSCIFLKHIYQHNPRVWEYRRYFILRKHLNLIFKNDSKIKPSVRTFLWSQILATSGKNGNKIETFTAIPKDGTQNTLGKSPSETPVQCVTAANSESQRQSLAAEQRAPCVPPTKPGTPSSSVAAVKIETLTKEDLKSQCEDKAKDKVLLENIKEQSLEKPEPSGVKPEASMAETLKAVKEKILDKKDTKKEPDAAKVPPRKQRKKVDLSASSLERNFITPVKAMADFLLKPSDLESLPKTKRRSPYECEPPITVYWRKDVEAKALEVWGSKENLLKEVLKRDIERRKYQQNIFTVKRRLRDYRRELGRTPDMVEAEAGLMGSSGKVVLTAVAINATNCLFKLFAWLYTGSHSMFSETIHSLADTINQIILAYGIHKSVQIADPYHPYGYSNMKYVASLISGVGIFCVGTGLSFYHGATGLFSSEPLEDFYWAYFILAGSLVSEGATCIVALNSVRKGARNANMSVKDYITRGQDPSVNVVLLEDFAAVIGVFVAGCCMGLSSLTHSPIPDSLGSLIIGCILGSVASFIIYSNVAALVGRSIPQESLDKINAELEADVMVRAIHDVKGIDMGNFLVRYKAELDFDGKELTKMYLDKQELAAILEEVKKFENIDQLEEFMLKHGENIVDMMGGEIDRIEMKLRKKHPEIRHCDLEIL